MGKLLVLALLFGSFTSCSKDVDDANASLGGKWILSDVLCFCVRNEYPLSEYTILFDPIANTATVENPDPSTNNILPVGIYPYFVENDVLTVNGDTSFTYEIVANRLQLFYDPSMAIDDEVTLTYTKN